MPTSLNQDADRKAAGAAVASYLREHSEFPAMQDLADEDTRRQQIAELYSTMDFYRNGRLMLDEVVGFFLAAADHYTNAALEEANRTYDSLPGEFYFMALFFFFVDVDWRFMIGGLFDFNFSTLKPTFGGRA